MGGEGRDGGDGGSLAGEVNSALGAPGDASGGLIGTGAPDRTWSVKETGRDRTEGRATVICHQVTRRDLST